MSERVKREREDANERREAEDEVEGKVRCFVEGAESKLVVRATSRMRRMYHDVACKWRLKVRVRDDFQRGR
jgi:hypothetical protein